MVAGASILVVGSSNSVTEPPALATLVVEATNFGGLLKKFYLLYQTPKNI